MTLLELKRYFEDLATLDADLKHDATDPAKRTFFCLNTDERANDLIRTHKLDLIMILMVPDKKMLPPVSENYNWNKNVCFMIIKRCNIKDDLAIIAAQSLCETIADDYCKQMINDRHGKITGLDISSFTMEPVGPVIDSHYGYICMFNLIDLFDQFTPSTRFGPIH